jgi:hypothetical protein
MANLETGKAAKVGTQASALENAADSAGFRLVRKSTKTGADRKPVVRAHMEDVLLFAGLPEVQTFLTFLRGKTPSERASVIKVLESEK